MHIIFIPCMVASMINIGLFIFLISNLQIEDYFYRLLASFLICVIMFLTGSLTAYNIICDMEFEETKKDTKFKEFLINIIRKI